jgi:pimeloyl-ACP methyl ester carboxylesterase
MGTEPNFEATQSGAVALSPALAGERRRFTGLAGRQTAYVAGPGMPLLLIHSINAAASAAEVRPLYDHYAKTRRVFAIDLPGYGFSDRSNRTYTPRLMTDAIHDAVAFIQADCGPTPIDVLALSLSCEFLARAAVERPAKFRSLALVSPTGFGKSRSLRGNYAAPRGFSGVHAALLGPGWGKWLYRMLTRKPVIRYFLNRTWGSSAIDEQLWQYDFETAHQPGAHFAPLYFLAARLFSADIHNIYDGLKVPVWVSHGTRGDFTDYDRLKLFENRVNWRSTVYPTGALPHFEVTPLFCTNYDAFLEQP